MPEREYEGVWLEWREDAESMWAEVYGVDERTQTTYPGDTLIVFNRAFGVWYSESTKKEFKNARSMKGWVKKIFELCNKKPNEFRNRLSFYEKILDDADSVYRT